MQMFALQRNKTLFSSAPFLKHLTDEHDSRCYRYKLAWILDVLCILQGLGIDFKGKNVLELGAGVHNPLGSAIVSAMLGARKSVAVEPGKLVETWAADGLVTLYLAAARFCGDSAVESRVECLERYLISLRESSSPNDVLNFCDFIAFYNDFSASSRLDCGFDIVHSNAVLEHIVDPVAVFRRIKEVSNPGSIHVHKIDFIDHDFYTDPSPDGISPFRFLLKDRVGQKNDTCNRLRFGQYCKLLDSLGFRIKEIPYRWRRPFPREYLDRLEPQFQNLALEDLETIGAVIVLQT